LVLLACALAIGIYYLVAHRSLLKQLAHIHPAVVALVLDSIHHHVWRPVRHIGGQLKTLPSKVRRDGNAKLNAHSLLINFFSWPSPARLTAALFIQAPSTPR